MLQNSYIRTLQKAMISMIVVLFAVACGDSGDDGAQGQTSASIKDPIVNCEEVRNVMTIEGTPGLQFTARITEGADWCSFAARTSQADTQGKTPASVFIYFEKNRSTTQRQATIDIEFSNGDRHQVIFSQMEYSSSSVFDRAWAEQPQYRENHDFIYKTYFTTLNNGQKVRNYSICYDTQRRVSHWVAYPLHTCYTLPNIGRTDEWSYDPNDQKPQIPTSVQQYVLKGYGSNPGTGRGYDRGHQCPSADRYSTKSTNAMTFYSTNMMPQASKFNQKLWGRLEGKVRDNIVSDTLYVVTGTYFANSKTIRDAGSNTVAVPSHCWKVLLRTKKGNTKKSIENCTADDLMGIGFWISNDNNYTDDLTKYAVSIEDVERKTGFKFFRNLSADAAKSVKQQKDPSAWRINN